MLPCGSFIKPNPEYGVWVGFNDLNPFQPDSDILVCTGSKHWAKPPRLGELAEVIAFDVARQEGRVIGHTMAVNYPVGARPQCVLKNGQPFYLLNNIENRLPCLDIYDYAFKKTRVVPGIHHWCTTRGLAYSYCANLSSSHEYGGYGYILPARPKSQHTYRFPDGISQYSHETGEHEQVLSLSMAIRIVAEHLCVPQHSISSHSYVSHLLLSPSEDKLACLFRFWLRDGGVFSALLSIDLGSKSPRRTKVEMAGQLSHFSWISNHELIIYVYQLLHCRSLRVRLNQHSKYIPVSSIAKAVAKVIRRLRSMSTLGINTPELQYIGDMPIFQVPQSLPSFLMTGNGKPRFFDVNLPPSDGHPSVSHRLGHKLLISDTYPNQGSERLLFAIDITKKSIVSLKKVLEYRPPFLPVYPWITRYTDLPGYASFSPSAQSFTRSGLHCDCHPFFNHDESKFAYHTTEDGYRTLKLQSL